MRKSLLLFYFTCLLAFLALINTSNVVAQTVDATGTFDEPITGTALIYTSLIGTDVNANGLTDMVFTLSQSPITAWSDYAVAARLIKNNNLDRLDIRNGSGMAAPENVIPVQFGVRYHVWMKVDVPNKTYTVWAKTDDMEAPVLIFRDAVFRTEQVNANISAINHWSALHNPSGEPDVLTVETVKLIAENETNANLAAINVAPGNLDQEFMPSVTGYTASVPEGTTSVAVSAAPAMPGATVTGTGTVDLASGKGVATLVVTAPDGAATKTYTVNIYVDGTYGPLALNHSYTFEDETATDVVGGANGTLNGGAISNGMYTSAAAGDHIELPAADIAINTYPAITLEAYITAGNATNGGFTMLSYFGGSVNNLGSNGYFMSIARGDNVSRTAISTGDEAAPWSAESGVNGPELEDGNQHHLVSILTDEFISWYIDGVHMGTAPLAAHNSIANLRNEYALLAKGGYLNDPTWKGSIHEFNIYEGVMDPATIEVHAAEFLAAQGPALATLAVDAGTLDPAFSPSVTEYALMVPEGTTTVNVTATANSEAAIVSGAGAVDVSSGSGTATIVVTAEDGATKTYTIDITVEEPFTGTNFALSLPGGANGANSNVAIPAIDITTLPVTIEMWFKPEGTQIGYAGLFYNSSPNAGGLAYVGWQNPGAVSGELGGVFNPEDQYSKRTFSDTYPVNDEWNHVAVVLTDTSRVLYLNGVAKVEEFTTTAPNFNQGTMYIGWHPTLPERTFKGLIDEVRIWNEARSAEELENTKYVTLEGTEENLVGYWNFDDQAEVATDVTGNGYDGVITGGTYAPSFNAADANLSVLTVDAGTLDPGFNASVTTYNVTVPAGTSQVTVSATPSHSAATVVGTEPVDVSNGSGTATIEVTAPDGITTKTYTVNFTAESVSSNANLSAVTVDIGTLNPVFDPSITNYTVEVPFGTTSVNVSTAASDEGATVSGDETVDLSSGSGTANFTVTAPNGDTKTYTIVFTVGAASSDATLAGITVDKGTLSPEFDFSETEYTLLVPKGTTEVNVTAATSDDGATVSGDGTVTLTGGSGTATIVVTAEDGSTMTYVIDISEDMETAVGDNLDALASVYPTVSADGFNVRFEGALGTIRVYDLSGKVVAEKVATSSEERITVAKAGMYIVHLQSREGSKKVKVFKVD